MTLVWAEWGRCGHALEACQGSLEMEGGTQHWRPVKALKRSEEMEGGIQENTFGISLTPPTGGSADNKN